jgi:hypothetical protein
MSHLWTTQPMPKTNNEGRREREAGVGRARQWTGQQRQHASEQFFFLCFVFALCESLRMAFDDERCSQTARDESQKKSLGCVDGWATGVTILLPLPIPSVRTPSWFLAVVVICSLALWDKIDDFWSHPISLFLLLLLLSCVRNHVRPH